ncbi:MAG: hypothetical protein ISF22_03485 [Methanomassiliicoccus sp.]|nr:hypothetical protein [Methanomassiliicoccus sp.]
MAKVPSFLSRLRIDPPLLSVALAALIMLQGAAIVAVARQIDMIEKWGTGLFQSTVALIGAQLLVLGLVAILAIVMSGDFLSNFSAVRKVRSLVLKDRAWLYRPLSWVPAAVGAVVMIEAMVVAYYSSPMVIHDLGGVRGMFPALFAAQLFLLGSGLVFFRLFEDRLDLPTASRSSIFLLFASAGVLVYGLADKANITGIGGVQESTFELAGLQLLILSLAAIALIYLDDRYFLAKRLFGWKIGTLGILAIAMVICFQGMVVASIAAPFRVDSIGGMVERTMLLAGLAMAILAMLVPGTYYFLEPKDKAIRKLAHTSCLFLVFMLPFAILM